MTDSDTMDRLGDVIISLRAENKTLREDNAEQIDQCTREINRLRGRLSNATLFSLLKEAHIVMGCCGDCGTTEFFDKLDDFISAPK